jgi:hypothetical protein
MPSFLPLLALSLLLSVISPEAPADPTTTRLQFLKDVAYNEIQDRADQSSWIYHVEKIVDGHTLSGEQAETKDGPIYRIFAIDGKPFSQQIQQQEDARITGLLSDPSQQAKVKQQYDADEQMLQKLTALLPQAFLYEDAGTENGNIRLHFRPNPKFTPPSYEARAVAAMAGTLWIEPRQKRLVRLQGQVVNPVEYGFGLLGRVEKGGSIDIQRTPVSNSHWKTSMVNVDFSGHAVLFKSINKQHHEIRSDFHPLAAGISLRDAEKLLTQDYVGIRR